MPRCSSLAAGSPFGIHGEARCRWFHRPKKTITKSQYNAEAKLIALRALEIQKDAKELRNEENANGRNRQWRAKTKALGKVLSRLEDDERALERQFPQVLRLHVVCLTTEARHGTAASTSSRNDHANCLISRVHGAEQSSHAWCAGAGPCFEVGALCAELSGGPLRRHRGCCAGRGLEHEVGDSRVAMHGMQGEDRDMKWVTHASPCMVCRARTVT